MRIGNLGSSARADVDQFGAVTTRLGTGITWLIGADDRWHAPHETAATRQRFVEGLPVVATAMRVPGGDIVATTYGARSSNGCDAAVIDFANDSALPVALSIVVSALRSIDLDGDVVVVDGARCIHLGKIPARNAQGSYDAVVEAVTSGKAATGWSGELQATWFQRRKKSPVCAAFVVPLTHRTSHRIAVAMDDAVGVDHPTTFADSDAVVRGWDAHLRSGIRIESADIVAGDWSMIRTTALLSAPSGDAAKQLCTFGFSDEAIGMAEDLWVAGDLRGVVAATAAVWRTQRKLPMIDGLDHILGEVLRVHAAEPTLMAECADVLDGIGQSDVAAKVRRDLEELPVHETVANRAVLRIVGTTIDVCPDATLVVQGNQVAVYDAPTPLGLFGFAIRWHGDRPALLWTLDPHDALANAVVTASTLDPSWSSGEFSGEVLLSTPPACIAR